MSITSKSWIFTVVLSLAAAAGADIRVAPVDAPDRYFARQRQDITIDGKLDEWRFDAAGNEVVIDPKQAKQHPGPVDSDSDLSARVRLAWEGRQLFVAARVRDQHLKPLPTAKANPWDCDSLMLIVTTFGATKGNPRFQEIKTHKRAKEPFFGFSYHTDVQPPAWTEHSSYVVSKTVEGYDIEGVIDLSDIGYQVQCGDRLKMAYILSDFDEDNALTQLLRGMPVGAVAVDIAANYWLDLRFCDGRPYAGELSAVQPTLTAGQALDLTGQVDVLDRDIELVGIRVRDESGKIVSEQRTAAALQAGKRYLVSANLPVASLPPGKYEFAMIVKDQGQESNGAVHGQFEIVKRVESSDTVVGNMPDRYLTPDAYRYINYSNPRDYKPMKLNRDDYIKVVYQVQEHWKARMYDKGRDADVGIYGCNYALPEYALYKHSGDKQRLETVLGLFWHMHEAHKTSAPSVIWTTQRRLAQLLLQDPDVPEADKVWIREVVPRMINKVWSESKPTEWGAFNRAMLWGILCDYAVQEIPDSPDAPRWKQYADLQWNSWWPFRDHDENASDYNCWSLLDTVSWAKFRDASALKDPGVVTMIERYMLQVTPAGGMPGYGDASPWHASGYYWIPLFELMASETRDGRFKWAAHRLLEYNLHQMDDLFSYHAIFDGAAFNCALAWLFADESVPEVAPDMRSRVLTRKRVLPVTDDMRKQFRDEHGIDGLFFYMTQDTQPDKLLLRAGVDPFSPNAMIELCSHAGHHVSTVPNINYFMQQRSVLLTDQGYFDKGPEFHNLVYIEDLSGITPEDKPEQVSVPTLKVGARATFADICIDWYKGWPVTNNRQVLFTHDGLMLVKDLVTFRQPFVTQVRQQWHTRNVGPGNGPHWVNAHIPFMLHSGLGLGGAATRWWNPSWDLLIYFTPQQQCEVELLDRTKDTPWQTVPLRVSQRWRGMPQQDKPLHFTTLLWPHKPDFDGAKYARAITTLTDSVACSALQVDVSDTQRLILGINDSGAMQKMGDVETDARVLVLEIALDGGKATPRRVYATDARTVKLAGQALHQSEQPADVDKGL